VLPRGAGYLHLKRFCGVRRFVELSGAVTKRVRVLRTFRAFSVPFRLLAKYGGDFVHRGHRPMAEFRII
jgi:hypothetical protein